MQDCKENGSEIIRKYTSLQGGTQMRVLPFSLYNRVLIDEKFVILQSYSGKVPPLWCDFHLFVNELFYKNIYYFL